MFKSLVLILALVAQEQPQNEIISFWGSGANFGYEIKNKQGLGHCENGPAYEDGDTVLWMKDGEWHRDDGGPALITRFGRLEWYKHGRSHRDDGPASIRSNGELRWLMDGYLHRLDGPAIITSDGKEWWQYGYKHRLDGPAIESKTLKQWWINGQLHREDGPAAIYANGRKEWWIHGELHRDGKPAII